MPGSEGRRKIPEAASASAQSPFACHRHRSSPQGWPNRRQFRGPVIACLLAFLGRLTFIDLSPPYLLSNTLSYFRLHLLPPSTWAPPPNWNVNVVDWVRVN